MALYSTDTLLHQVPHHHWALRCLPPLPAAAVKTLRLLDDPHADIRAFTEVISTDPSFTWEVLRAANSPLFSFPFRIDDLFQATALIGVERVRGMVFVAALSTGFGHALREESLLDCWKHSLATAFLAAEMAPAFQVDAGKAYTAGLLHDLGRLAFMTSYPAKYTELISRSFRDQVEMCSLEQQFFEIDHCLAGASIASSWSLPLSIAEVCLKHHEPVEHTATRLLQNIVAANRTAHLYGFRPVYETSSTQSPTELPNWVSGQIEKAAQVLRQRIDSFCICH
jgi:putative nucleotidyltransferase with HDIG domain